MTLKAYTMRFGGTVLLMGSLVVIGASFSDNVWSEICRFGARDPGVRPGSASARAMLPALTPSEKQAFEVGLEAFQEAQSVQGTFPDTEAGLGLRFNLDSCAGCHINPGIGGTSPAINPQVEMAKKEGANNEVPSFIKKDGPIREARFQFNQEVPHRGRSPECRLSHSDAVVWRRIDRSHRRRYDPRQSDGS